MSTLTKWLLALAVTVAVGHYAAVESITAQQEAEDVASDVSEAKKQAAEDKANNTTKHIDKRRKAGDDVRAVRGMGAVHILRQQQVVAYSKAKVSTK
jgi:predicted flap endonuclease-1-like 5' DNA nuclease